MRTTFSASDGNALSAEDFGVRAGPALILLHSLGCDGRMWMRQVAAMESEFRIIVPDSRGHGQSSAPNGHYALDRLGQDVLDIINDLGVPTAHVCGLSMGGLVAQWLAINAPSRVDRLVLANTASRLGSTASWQEREAMVRAGGMAAIAETVLGRFLGAAFQHANPMVTQQIRQTLLETPSQGYCGCCAALRCSDLSVQVGNIRKPTLVIGGDRDLSTPQEQTRLLQTAIEGATLLVLDAAHLSNVEQQDAFTAALRAHLALEPA